MKKVKKMFIILPAMVVAAITTIGCNSANQSNDKIKNLDISSVVNETFLTQKGYSDELAKHVSKEVFDSTNLYSIFSFDDDTKPSNIEFSLEEKSKNINKDIVDVNMIYTVEIKDSKGEVTNGSWNIPITFKVEIKDDNEWFIIQKDEQA